ncbi:MAG TPA: RNA 3'-terminal phosphate cyclase [archaeon]|nr:RNA 3'-terminal phosphate cyclase [archaeon]
MLEIDGSRDEGGGAIVRLSVALSALTGKPCRIKNIRANRKNPGLQRQHIAAVAAVAALCGATVNGNEITSAELEFSPGKITGGKIDIDIGSAGSIALVLQALMIPAMKSESPVSVSVKGGTINKWAPSVDYIRNVTLPLLKKSGYCGEIGVRRHGFYPKGGGLVEAVIFPSSLTKFNIVKRGKLLRVYGTCTASKSLAAAKVAERIKTESMRLLRPFGIAPEIALEYVDAASLGGGIGIFAQYENSVTGGSAVAEQARSAESLAKEACEALIKAHESGAALDEHMADQILPYLAITGGAASAAAATAHCKSNAYVIEKFLGVKIKIIPEKNMIRFSA